jgi:hypothetical protein
MANDPTLPSTNTLGSEASVNAGLPKYIRDLIQLVRSKLRDFPELNRLIAGYESSDKQIALAMLEALDDWNTTPPLIDSVSLSSFPSVSLLINGTIIHLIESIGLLQTRNHMTYSDGQGIQVSVSDKTPMLMQWLNLFKSQYERKKTQLKQAINLRDALNGSGVSSEYALINGYFEELE